MTCVREEVSMMTQLLVAVGLNKGLAAHIPGDGGKPLCRAQLNLTLWQLQDQAAEGLHICGNCKRNQAKNEPSQIESDREGA